MTEITQQTFERYVPSFRDSESRTFDAIRPSIESTATAWADEMQINELLTADAAKLLPLFEAAVCRRAAYLAVPHLDLVLTESGFAVVGNQNLSPASKERVAALRERLREEKSDSRDELVLYLMQNAAWRESVGRRTLTTLLWCPTLCRRCGITFEGRRVYAEEFSTCFASLMHAHFTASRIVSFEQMQWLLAHQCDTALEKKEVGTDDPRYTLIDLVRTLMAALVMQHKPSERRATEEVQSFLNRHADALPEYRASSKYEADQFKPYQNEPHDPCFFFG